MDLILVLLGVLVAVPAIGAILLFVWWMKAREALATSQREATSLRQQLTQSEERLMNLQREYGPIAADTHRYQQLRAEILRLESQLTAAASRNAEAERTAAGIIAAAERHGAALIEGAHRTITERESVANTRIEQLRRLADDNERQIEGRRQELLRSITGLEEKAELQSMGFYQLHYNFESSAQYEARLEQVREHQKVMMKDGTAVICTTQWQVDGDRRAGDRMVRDQSRLMLRAFNGECDAAVMRVKYNNIAALERRIQADFDAINKIGTSKHCHISQAYFDLKLAELRIVFEYQERKQKEAEEQRALREQMRDEERAQKEMEQARREAERDEQRYQQAIEKARREVVAATGRQRESLEQKIAELEARLAEATSKQKAISQAQLTAAGHVYVISNLGSFGEHVYKIGMTRRLDPMDRVYELGDASVPFPFDVHAMIRTENAPELERLLHKRFHVRRLNRINERKEFFRVTLDEIEQATAEVVSTLPRHVHREILFTRTAAAEEFRKTQAMAAQQPLLMTAPSATAMLAPTEKPHAALPVAEARTG
jgi:hypothetical protein